MPKSTSYIRWVEDAQKRAGASVDATPFTAIEVYNELVARIEDNEDFAAIRNPFFRNRRKLEELEKESPRVRSFLGQNNSELQDYDYQVGNMRKLYERLSKGRAGEVFPWLEEQLEKGGPTKYREYFETYKGIVVPQEQNEFLKLFLEYVNRKKGSQTPKASGSVPPASTPPPAASGPGYVQMAKDAAKAALFKILLAFGEGMADSVGAEDQQTKAAYKARLDDEAEKEGVELNEEEKASVFRRWWDKFVGNREDPEQAAAEAVEVIGTTRRALGKDPLGYPRAPDPTSPYGRRNFYYEVDDRLRGL